MAFGHISGKGKIVFYVFYWSGNIINRKKIEFWCKLMYHGASKSALISFIIFWRLSNYFWILSNLYQHCRNQSWVCRNKIIVELFLLIVQTFKNNVEYTMMFVESKVMIVESLINCRNSYNFVQERTKKCVWLNHAS